MGRNLRTFFIDDPLGSYVDIFFKLFIHYLVILTVFRTLILSAYVKLLVDL